MKGEVTVDAYDGNKTAYFSKIEVLLKKDIDVPYAPRFLLKAGDNLDDLVDGTAIDGYEFVGISDGAKLVTGTAATDGYHYAIYAKVNAYGAVKHAEEDGKAGIRYRFVIDFLNADYLTERDGITVKLTLTDEDEGSKVLKTYEDANFVIENGQLCTSVLVTGWTKENCEQWNHKNLKAVLEITFKDGTTLNTPTVSGSANSIAQQVADQLTPDEKELYGVQ